MEAKYKHKVVLPLDSGGEFVLWLPKPAAELTSVEVFEIVEALKREVRRRGSA
jgi:hypothetical protein